jgi:hypothetical protein
MPDKQAVQNVAIIGMGKMGLLHASILNVLSSAPIVGLVDQDEGLGARVRSMGLQAPFLKSIDEVLAQSSVDAVFVYTPAFAHPPCRDGQSRIRFEPTIWRRGVLQRGRGLHQGMPTKETGSSFLV